MKSIIALFFVLIFSCSAQEAKSQESLLDQMTGNWVLKGTIDGKETTHDITIAWVLGHQYVQITETSREKDVQGNPLYDANVFISRDSDLNEFACLWLDNTGNGGLSGQAIGHAKQDGDKIEFLFKSGGSGTFHTTFLYDRISDTWQWLMDVEENNNYQPFARLKLTRK